MTTMTCTCRKHDDGSRTWKRHCPDHGEAYVLANLLPRGARVRHVRYPDLTGTIKAHEWTDREHISPIPYNVAWDDNSRACDVLGWMFIYACVEDLERLPEADAPFDEQDLTQ